MESSLDVLSMAAELQPEPPGRSVRTKPKWSLSCAVAQACEDLASVKTSVKTAAPASQTLSPEDSPFKA